MLNNKIYIKPESEINIEPIKSESDDIKLLDAMFVKTKIKPETNNRYILFSFKDEIIYGDNWMQRLYDLVIKKTNYKLHLYELALVGTNNSMSYGINGFSSWTPDNGKINILNMSLNMLSWTGINHLYLSDLKIQNNSLVEQFKIGCRVFDLKIIESKGSYFGTNKLISCNFIHELIKLKQIIKNEIVIFIFQKLYCDPVKFFEVVDYIFETNIIDNINNLEIHNLISKNKNLLIFVNEYVPKLNIKKINLLKDYHIYSLNKLKIDYFNMGNLLDLRTNLNHYTYNYKQNPNNLFYKSDRLPNNNHFKERICGFMLI